MEKITRVVSGEYNVYYLTNENNVYTYVWNQAALNTVITSSGVYTDVAVGLHSGLFLDASGSVWSFGDNTYGQIGNGVSGSTVTLYEVTKDVNGNSFNNISNVYYLMYMSIARKNDGSIWVWGEDLINVNSGKNMLLPTPLTMPSGAFIEKVVPQGPTYMNIGGLLGLDNKGGVWEWKGGNLVATKVTLPGAAQDIAAIYQKASIAVVSGVPYGWGLEGSYMGVTGSSSWWAPISEPINLSVSWSLQAPIVSIVGNSDTFHYIDVSGSLWGLGDNVQGEIGNGQETNWLTYTASGQPSPYSWDWAKYELMVMKPVHIASNTKFSQVIGGSSYVFYTYAQDTSGSWYSWGRNKGLVLGNGLETNSTYQSTYPNLIDVTSPKLVTPLTSTVTTLNVVMSGSIPIVTNYPTASSTPTGSNSGSITTPQVIISLYNDFTWKYV